MRPKKKGHWKFEFKDFDPKSKPFLAAQSYCYKQELYKALV